MTEALTQIRTQPPETAVIFIVLTTTANCSVTLVLFSVFWCRSSARHVTDVDKTVRVVVNAGHSELGIAVLRRNATLPFFGSKQMCLTVSDNLVHKFIRLHFSELKNR